MQPSTRSPGPSGVRSWEGALLVLLGGCAAGPRATPGGPVRVSCGGLHVTVPHDLVVLRATATELIAASREVALIVTTDEPEPPRRWAGAGVLIDQVSDRDHPGFLQGYRRVASCTFRAVASRAAGATGDEVLAEVVGPDREYWTIGSPRVPIEPALTVGLRLLEAAREHAR